MFLLCVTLGSRVIPSIFGLMFMISVVLFICSASSVLCSAGYGVKRVHVVLSGLRMKLFVCFHVRISCICDLIFVFVMFVVCVLMSW